MSSNTIQQTRVQSIWQKADAVCFDVDSTLLKNEGLDDLAEFCGKGKEVKALTVKAMEGAVSFQDSLSERLQILKPTQHLVEQFVTTKPPQFSDGIKELVSLLQSRNTQIFLVSGGFRQIIEPAARCLQIPVENIFANKIIFDENGQYASFDVNQPTSKSGGKPRVMGLLKKEFSFQNLVMIGDGVTDMEASPPADAFIGYGGNVVREIVKEKADWYVTDFQKLISVLKEPDTQSSEHL